MKDAVTFTSSPTDNCEAEACKMNGNDKIDCGFRCQRRAVEAKRTENYVICVLLFSSCDAHVLLPKPQFFDTLLEINMKLTRILGKNALF